MDLRPDVTPAYNPKDGSKWKAMGICFALIGFLLVGWADNRFPVIYTLLAAAPFIFGGHWSYRRGLRLKAINGDSLLHDDDRAPVLYLRSFLSDGTPAPETAGILNSWRGDEEEQIEHAMNEIGPFVAIGRPGEDLPELEAARIYRKGEDWQSWVTRMIGSAQLIILRAGTTEGFWWEVRQVAALAKPERVVFLLPFGHAQYAKFRERAEGMLLCKLPDHPHKRKSIWTRPIGGEVESGSLQAVLYFDNDWTPRIEPIKIPFYLKRITPAGGSWIPMYAYIAPPSHHVSRQEGDLSRFGQAWACLESASRESGWRRAITDPGFHPDLLRNRMGICRLPLTDSDLILRRGESIRVAAQADSRLERTAIGAHISSVSFRESVLKMPFSLQIVLDSSPNRSSTAD
jgi:hypothetical protein